MHAMFIGIALLLFLSTSGAQKNDQELFEQQQIAFCQLWKNSPVDRKFSLSRLCFVLTRKFDNQVYSQMFDSILL
jgi:hypothetical protein